MRKIRITRKKTFVGSVIPYICTIGIGKEFVDEEDGRYAIKNGETIEIEVGSQSFCVVISANTSTGSVTSKPVVFPEGEENLDTELITKYSWIKGSSYELRCIESH